MPIPTRLEVASIKNVLLSKFRLFGIETAVPVRVKVSPDALPRVVFPSIDRSEFPVMLPVTPRVPVIEVFSLIATFPVVDPPSVNVWLLVVPRLPRPVRKVLLSPEFAEIEAVGYHHWYW